MITVDQKELKQWLYALEQERDNYFHGETDGAPEYLYEAIAAIKEALAQTSGSVEQEPVAWMDIDEKGFGYGLRYWSEPDNRHEVPLYTTPPQRKPLTNEQLERLIVQSGGHKSTHNLMSNPMQVREHVELWNERIYKFARAIEAAHGIGEKK